MIFFYVISPFNTHTTYSIWRIFLKNISLWFFNGTITFSSCRWNFSWNFFYLYSWFKRWIFWHCCYNWCCCVGFPLHPSFQSLKKNKKQKNLLTIHNFSLNIFSEPVINQYYMLQWKAIQYCTSPKTMKTESHFRQLT